MLPKQSVLISETYGFVLSLYCAIKADTIEVKLTARKLWLANILVCLM